MEKHPSSNVRWIGTIIAVFLITTWAFFCPYLFTALQIDTAFAQSLLLGGISVIIATVGVACDIYRRRKVENRFK